MFGKERNKGAVSDRKQLSEIRGGYDVSGLSTGDFVNRANRLMKKGMPTQDAFDQAYQDTFGPTANYTIPDCWGPWPGSRHDRKKKG